MLCIIFIYFPGGGKFLDISNRSNLDLILCNHFLLCWNWKSYYKYLCEDHAFSFTLSSSQKTCDQFDHMMIRQQKNMYPCAWVQAQQGSWTSANKNRFIVGLSRTFYSRFWFVRSVENTSLFLSHEINIWCIKPSLFDAFGASRIVQIPMNMTCFFTSHSPAQNKRNSQCCEKPFTAVLKSADLHLPNSKTRRLSTIF